jgi:hypothetical protein
MRNIKLGPQIDNKAAFDHNKLKAIGEAPHKAKHTVCCFDEVLFVWEGGAERWIKKRKQWIELKSSQ